MTLGANYQYKYKSNEKKSPPELILIAKRALVLVLIISVYSCKSDQVDLDKIYEKPVLNEDPPAPSLSPEESMSTIYLPDGYKLELVASEPMIEEPIDIVWDGNGNMYVAELLTYMQDIDGNDEDEPWSRVSMLQDTNDDGIMDKSTVFVDSLLLPRIILPLDDQIIIAETYTQNFWTYKDTDGDGVADEKKMVFENPELFKGNLEHQYANLTWGIDNWMYVSKNSFRYKWENNKMEIDTMLDPTDGQYGLTQDEIGRLYYSRAGSEIAALGFQQHPTYGRLEMDGKWDEGFEEPWPIIGTPDVQGGEKRLREDNTLNKFTGVSGQAIFLGDRLPMYGDLFIPEPVGRLVRRATVANIDGKIVLSNPYEKTEFMASTDPNFRPVMAKTGPDGCLYIVDMHRGIIQEGNWVKEDSYLRPEVERRNLDKNIGKGRIYRIVHEKMEPSKPIKLLDLSNEELVSYLNHKNGWYRFNAQKLLVLRGDKSIVPQLSQILKSAVNTNDQALARLHALWTLDGLKSTSTTVLFEAFKDPDPRVRSAAIRISEQFIGNDDDIVFKELDNLSEDVNIDVLLQVINSAKLHPNRDKALALIDKIKDAHPDNEVIAVSAKIAPPEIQLLKKKHTLTNRRKKPAIIAGYDIYKGLCAACHGDKGQGVQDVGPSLQHSARLNASNDSIPIAILLNGLVGPIDGKEYGTMIPMKNYDDKWISDVLNYVREEIGEGGDYVSERKVRALREEYKDRTESWTIEELTQKFKQE